MWILIVAVTATFIDTAYAKSTATRSKPTPMDPSARPLRINPSTVTMSGISAGGAFGVQFAIAYSSLIRANGVIAGVPYLCAEGSLAGALTCMNDPQMINMGTIMTQIDLLAFEGRIDNTSSVAAQYVQLFSGTLDTIVQHGTMLAVQTMYKALGVSNLVSFFNYPAEHAWVTNDFGNPCEYLGAPFINNCGLDFAGVFLKGAFEQMGVKWNATRGALRSANLHTVSQTPYGANPLFNSLATEGYIYIPTKCQANNASCHLHVNFHGCEQESSAVGVEYVLNTGLNEWAEANEIVVLYPQAASNALLDNPNGCFDWWGYASPQYTEKGEGQLGIIRSLMKGIANV